MKVQGNITLIIAMIFVAIMSRLIPHYPNFTAVGAVALFGGAYLSKKWAFVIPLLALFISDLLLNNLMYAQYYDGFAMFTSGAIWTYAAFALVIGVGITVLSKVSGTRFLGASVIAAVLFFVVTNLGVWASSAMYAKDITGLIACFTAAVPFFWNTLMGNLLFGSVLFGAYEFIIQRQARRKENQIIEH